MWDSKKLKDLIYIDEVMTFIPSWPLVVHLLSGCFCLGCSALYHTFFITNKRMFNLFSRLDFGGICMLIMGSSYPPIFYPFSCSPVNDGRNFFLILITTSCTCTFLGMLTDRMNANDFTLVRALVFIFLGLSAGVPWIYIHFNSKENARFYLPTCDGIPWLLGGVAYIAGALLYGFKIPDRKSVV